MAPLAIVRARRQHPSGRRSRCPANRRQCSKSYGVASTTRLAVPLYVFGICATCNSTTAAPGAQGHKNRRWRYRERRFFPKIAKWRCNDSLDRRIDGRQIRVSKRRSHCRQKSGAGVVSTSVEITTLLWGGVDGNGVAFLGRSNHCPRFSGQLLSSGAGGYAPGSMCCQLHHQTRRRAPDRACVSVCALLRRGLRHASRHGVIEAK